MNWLTIDNLLYFHKQILEATGGVAGILNFGALEAALEAPFTSYDNEDLFPNLWDITAVFVERLVSLHPFVDGNKRTAFVAADVCLKLNEDGRFLLQ